MSKKRTAVIITAAGSGTRMGPDGKLHLSIGDKSILSRTLSKFKDLDIEEMIIAIREEEKEDVAALVERLCFAYPVKIVLGGKERHHSVNEALNEVSNNIDVVLIHDGARPFVKISDIRKVMKACETMPACALAVPSTDTVKVAREDLSVVITPDRSSLYNVQTPQGFDKKVLKKAYEYAFKEGIAGTDDCSIVEVFGVKVQLILGSKTNIKITTQADLIFGEAIIGEEE